LTFSLRLFCSYRYDLAAAGLGNHAAPISPVITTVINLLNAAKWRAWGHEPSIAVGHSIGEVAAAVVSGLLTVKEALRLADTLGKVIHAPGSEHPAHNR
jgi:acyl transferase domain-containing protein